VLSAGAAQDATIASATGVAARSNKELQPRRVCRSLLWWTGALSSRPVTRAGVCKRPVPTSATAEFQSSVQCDEIAPKEPAPNWALVTKQRPNRAPADRHESTLNERARLAEVEHGDWNDDSHLLHHTSGCPTAAGNGAIARADSSDDSAERD
jgi:hypothetical protein